MTIDHLALALEKERYEDFWKDATNPRILEQFPKYPEPTTRALIEFHFKSGLSERIEHRCYDVKRTVNRNGYIPKYSSGSYLYTDQDSGPSGEPIVKQIRWHATEGIGYYIGSFEEWRDVLWFILFQMRGTITEVVKD